MIYIYLELKIENIELIINQWIAVKELQNQELQNQNWSCNEKSRLTFEIFSQSFRVCVNFLPLFLF